MTFSEWYNSLDQLDKPQFTGYTNKNGKQMKIVYSVDPALWRLSDYVVSSRMSEMVHLIER